MEIVTSKIVVTKTESGVLEFHLLDMGLVASSYDLLALVADAEDEKFAEDLLRYLDYWEANQAVKDSTYWTLRGCVRGHMTWVDMIRERKYTDVKNCSKTYLMLDVNTGFVKIGRSVHPRKREATLQSKKPTISLLKICDENIESKLHKIYASKRVRGEWFKLSKQDIKNIIKQYNFYDCE